MELNNFILKIDQIATICTGENETTVGSTAEGENLMRL